MATIYTVFLSNFPNQNYMMNIRGLGFFSSLYVLCNMNLSLLLEIYEIKS